MSKYNRRLMRQSVQDQIDSILSSTRTGSGNTNTFHVVNTPTGEQGVICTLSQNAFEESLANLPASAYGSLKTKAQIFDAITKERDYQDEKWGAGKEQSLPGFLLVIEKELEEAKEGWVKNKEGRHSALAEIVQIAATCVACLEKYGTEGNSISTDDIPDPSSR